MKIAKIDIEEFKNKIYLEYISLFPDEEQRDWEDIEYSYNSGIEQFYKIVFENDIIGFIMLEKLNNKLPFYIDFFAIFKQYQNKGYGTMAIKYLINNIIGNNSLLLEIEKENSKDLNTVRRAKFYENLGFKKVNSEYLLFGVKYTPYIFENNNKLNKIEIDEIMKNYYKTNCGEESLLENFDILF